MYSFQNDYSEGAHPRILEALQSTNLVQTDVYGDDIHTQKAIALLKSKIGRDDIAVHLIPGGTQTNLIAMSAFLRPCEAVISANTGHVNVHETGAIEATGHKIIDVVVPDGKLRPEDVKKVLAFHTDEHMVVPRLVYISNSTEVGTVYTRDELEKLSVFCRQNNLLFYLDGARLGSALCTAGSNLSLSDVCDLVDAFYIGGTKNGALLGEALVICNAQLNNHIRHVIKQRGGMLAKGRILGIQFEELFKDDLYFELAAYTNAMADLLRNAIQALGYSFLSPSLSNQLFPILPNDLIEKLKESYQFITWSQVDARYSCIRLVTSWATPKEAVMQLIGDIQTYTARQQVPSAT